MTEVFSTLSPVIEKHPEYEKVALLERMAEPDRQISFRVIWEDDSGKIRVKAIAGGTFAGGPGGTGGSEIEREISILSRGVRGWNNGWL